MPYDYVAQNYTPFEQNLALSWANAQFHTWLTTHADAPFVEQEKAFFEFLESGLTVALEFRNQNS